jgi:phosphopentomutase
MGSGRRAVVMVLDSVGVGELPDAAEYGDTGSNTLGNTAAAAGGLSMPNLGAWGLGNVVGVAGVPPASVPLASLGRCSEASIGKDTTTGHWELMGLRVECPFPTYPEGFPRDLMNAFEDITGLGWLGNKPASGTAIIQELGAEHVRTGKPIVYTSADSVLQIAAHEDVIPIERLYDLCELVRTRVVVGPHAVGRVIARPFVGPDGAGLFTRTHRRRDFALAPTTPTVLDVLAAAGIATYGVGKIGEIFAWRGVEECPHITDNMDGIDKTLDRIALTERGFVFVNLVDFDMLWGHRNDVKGYAQGLEAVDRRIPEVFEALDDGDLMIVTADHGCDPTMPSTDHSREYVPVLARVKGSQGARPLGTRTSFSDVGMTVLDFFGVEAGALHGESFLAEVLGQ